jgi:hypothetical protein
MELYGALSNPLTSHKPLHTGRLAALKAELLERERGADQLSRRLPGRQGSVVATVTKALELANQPMRVAEIHAAVDDILSAPVSYSAVKEALRAHARGSNPRFRRLRHGVYELA